MEEQARPRVLVTDATAEIDLERAVLDGVPVEALVALAGQAPTPDDLIRAVRERPTPVLIAFHLMVFDAPMLALLARAGVRGLVRSGSRGELEHNEHS